jgi:hypothetical protein
VTTCYLCAAHSAPSEDPSAIGCCSTCGVFTCRYDGARVHGKGEFRCAICLVRVLLDSAGVLDPSGGPDGGGGIAATEKRVERAREFLGTREFEEECRELASRSGGHRYAWRDWLAQAHVSQTAAREFGERLEVLAGAGTNVAERVEQGLTTDTVDRHLLADAAGVGEYALRLSAQEAGPVTLASVARERAESAEEDARAAEAAARLRVLEANLTEESVPDRSQVIGATPQKKTEEKKEEKVKYLGSGE